LKPNEKAPVRGLLTFKPEWQTVLSKRAVALPSDDYSGVFVVTPVKLAEPV